MEVKKINGNKVRATKTKNKIYQCADQLFKEYGFDNVSVDSIVEKAGISKGTFYVHFDSKDSLIVALITEYVSKLDLDYRAFLKSFPEDTSSSVVLFSLVEKIADFIGSSIGYIEMKNVYRIQIDRTVDTSMLLGANRDIYGTFQDLIDQGIRQGEFRSDFSAKTVAVHLVMAMRGLCYEWCIRYPDFNLKEQMMEHFTLLLSGLKKV
ncbi:TetR/AcrR family transcriptional regulator [Aminipila sp.]|uniref:TetR/AcrR family transcriptional regulator n=1 Tax=Aminipila sp. TaxID=2060095 RepID=UPI00289DC063|nr:TetR/AcrR family transcriptional regulator [Aminipila sp.]